MSDPSRAADADGLSFTAHPPERGAAEPVSLPCGGCCCCCCCCLHSIGSLLGGVISSVLAETAYHHKQYALDYDPEEGYRVRRDVPTEMMPLPVAAVYWLLVVLVLCGVAAYYFVTNASTSQPEELLYGLLIGLFFLPLVQLAASALTLPVLLAYTDRLGALVRLGKITLWSFVGGVGGTLIMVGGCWGMGAFR